MPKFRLNKLVRDKLKDEYAKSGYRVVYRELSKTEHISELKRKIIEEVKEIPDDVHDEEFISEVADLQQAIDDLKSVSSISDDKLRKMQSKKFEKKGGFTGATFVETIEVEDEWVEYYRKKPDVYPEID